MVENALQEQVIPKNGHIEHPLGREVLAAQHEAVKRYYREQFQEKHEEIQRHNDEILQKTSHIKRLLLFREAYTIFCNHSLGLSKKEIRTRWEALHNEIEIFSAKYGHDVVIKFISRRELFNKNPNLELGFKGMALIFKISNEKQDKALELIRSLQVKGALFVEDDTIRQREATSNCFRN